jgi:ElaB/YqjD/DUF883 family membrane-anchored ribosome-binding protein
MRTNGNGTRHPEEILAEIERTRSEMDRTLGTIEQRLTPGQLLDQGMHYLKTSGAGDYVRNLRGSVSSNPLPIALVGVGLAWLMAADRMDRTRPSDPAEGTTSEGLKQRAASTLSGMKDSASSMQQRASGAMASGREKLDQTARMARENAQRLGASYDRMVHEQPLALGAVGLAIGAVLAASLPRTRAEEELLSGSRESIADKAAEAARQMEQKGHEALEQGRRNVEQANAPQERAQEERPASPPRSLPAGP